MRKLLLAECVFIFGIFPAALSALKPHNLMYVVLWVLTAGALVWLYRQPGYSMKADWNKAGLTRLAWRRILMRFLPLALALFLFTALVVPAHLFSLPRYNPMMWWTVMMLYPLLSAIPQEVLLRSYFFRRYALLFPQGRAMIVASALAFGWMHVLLQNWVAVSFSFVGGLMISDTYRRTNSLAAACAEHALYGCYIFTLGLGVFFYHGAAVK